MVVVGVVVGLLELRRVEEIFMGRIFGVTGFMQWAENLVCRYRSLAEMRRPSESDGKKLPRCLEILKSRLASLLFHHNLTL